MRRIAAVVGAVALVALAVAVRARLAEPERGSAAEPAVLVCSSELATVCRDLDAARPELTVVVEDAGVTQARLVAAEAATAGEELDGWLVPQPYAAMVAEQRGATGAEPVLGDPGPVLARSPLVMAVWAERLPTLEQHCGEVTWRCVGEIADGPWTDVGGSASWGDVVVGFPPIATAAGLLGVSEASASWFDTTEFARNDFDDTSYLTWLNGLARSSKRAVPAGSTPVTELLTKGPAAIQIASGTEAEAGPLIAGSARPERVRVLYPSPMVTADLVLAPVLGAPGASTLEEILGSSQTAEALAAAGWRVDGQPLAAGVDGGVALPDTNGTPRAGVLVALEAVWNRAG